jgi:hypothetical protein
LVRIRFWESWLPEVWNFVPGCDILNAGMIFWNWEYHLYLNIAVCTYLTTWVWYFEFGYDTLELEIAFCIWVRYFAPGKKSVSGYETLYPNGVMSNTVCELNS